MQDFRKLDVWRKAHELVLGIYQATTEFPKAELYGLASQLRRAAASVPTNIAEGCGRPTDPDFRRFLAMALGSASELEYLLLLTRDLGFVDGDAEVALSSQTVEVKRMLSGLIRKLKADS